MKQYWIYIILIHINLTVYAQAPDFRFDRIGLEDGLPNMAVDALFQDSHGFIWVGTWAGLCRYDGREFVVFTSDRNDSTSIGSNEIKDIVETPDGRIWIAGYGRQNVYNPQLNKFHSWGPPLGSSFYADKTGNLYFLETGSDGFYKVNYDSLDDGSFKENFSELSKIPLNLNSLLYNERLIIDRHPRMDRLGDQLWIGTIAGLRIMDLHTEELLDISNIYPKLNDFQAALLTEIKIDSYGRVWLGTPNELWKYNPQSQSLRKYNLGNGSDPVMINVITEDQNGGIWTGTSDGLYYLMNQADSFTVYRHNPDDPFSLSHNEIRSLMVDNNNNLWVGTARGGLNKTYLNAKPTFHTINHTHFGSRNHELVVFAFEASGKEHIWVGTNQGLFLLNKDNKKIIRRYSRGNADTLGLAAETVLSIYETQDRKVYLGTRPGGLNILDLNSNKMTHVEVQHQRNSNKLAGNFFRSIKPAMSGEDSLWLAGPRGVSLLIRNEPIKYKSFPLYRYWDVKQLDSCTIEVFGNGKYVYDICRDTFLLKGFWAKQG
ncbi:MAG: two-component regulator propeller domain-containing protein [Bacteroidia bacterium]